MHKHPEQKVHAPDNLSDLLASLRQRPESLLMSGGTWIGSSSLMRIHMHDQDIFWTGRIEELKRIFRSDRFLEIGASASFDRIIHLDGHLIPQGLRQALLNTVPTPVRSLATLGGNLCIPDESLNLLPFMSLWDARLELRKQGVSRYLPATEFINAEHELNLDPGEILVRIRVPLGRWNMQAYERLAADPRHNVPSQAFCGLVRIHRNLIEEFRVARIFSNYRWHANEQIDAQMIGQKLPIAEKAMQHWIDDSLKSLHETHDSVHQLVLNRFRTLSLRFARSIRPDYTE